MSDPARSRGGGGGRRARLNPGRLAAARTLLSVQDGAHAEDILEAVAPADGPDRRLAWHLALGVLRRQGSLDQALSSHLKRGGVAGLDPAVRAALRIGAFDLLFSRTPRHAAVSQAVELCRRLKAGRASGLVNAVLRRTEPADLPTDPMADLPAWLADRWREWPDWVVRLREPAPLCGVWRDAPVASLAVSPATAGGDPVAGAFVVTDPTGPVPQLPGFADGAWWVMDPSAASVADLCVPAGGTAAGLRVLDACAAPGGKTLRLAALGARVTVVDLEAHRLALVRENLARTRLSAEHVAEWDWLDGPHPELGTFDVVLVDAPCSALGIVRRHPEITWRRQPTDPLAMSLRQREILAAAAHHVAPGGRLIYAVCSPMPEEGVQVAHDLAGWRVAATWSSSPPVGDEDAFQAFVLTHSS